MPRFNNASMHRTPGSARGKTGSSNKHDGINGGSSMDFDMTGGNDAFSSFTHNAEGDEMGEAQAPVASPSNEKGMDLTDIFKTLAQGYQLLCNYKCKEAVHAFMSLPRSQYLTGWVLVQMGRAYFEMVDYNKATHMFELARKTEPHRVKGMEYYSTALWHLKKEVQLSFLAQQLVDFDKLAPETWIVVGNCFSLQKEHETALKFFRRAIQLDAWCAYAYTLSAHEYVANEDFDKALAGYRHSIGVNERHYNAWYGIGNIYYRQEKYELAAYHFKRAVGINDRSSVLYCYLGMVLHASRRYQQALDMLEKADQLEPTNPLAKFQKANVYMSLEEYAMALAQLENVKEFAPREASVHFLMGKIYKKLGKVDQAMLRFITALDLDPKDRNLVKSAIDKLHAPSNGDDSASEDEF